VSALFTGVLGIQPYPVWIEVIAWLAYLVPMGVLAGWPSGGTRGTPAGRAARGTPQPADGLPS
jgi:high-affinity iron transporter